MTVIREYFNWLEKAMQQHTNMHYIEDQGNNQKPCLPSPTFLKEDYDKIYFSNFQKIFGNSANLQMLIELSADKKDLINFRNFELLLQMEVEESNHASVNMLLKHGTSVNNIIVHKHCWSASHPCKSIMCSVFKNDDPIMMGILSPAYDRKCNFGGKCLLYMACRLGAVKCVRRLLSDPLYRKDADMSEISTRDKMKNKFKIDRKVCTANALGYCLHEVVGYRKKKELVESLTTLLELGAPINFQVNSKYGMETPLDILLKTFDMFDMPICIETFAEAVSLLLAKGGVCQFETVQDFLNSVFFSANKHHRLYRFHGQRTVQEFYLSMKSILLCKENLKKYKGNMNKNGLHFGMFIQYDIDTQTNLYHILYLASVVEKISCIKFKEFLRQAIVDFDHDFKWQYWPELAHIYGLQLGMESECDCARYMARLWSQVWKQSQYKKFVETLLKVDSKRSGRKFDIIRQQFPSMRPLKELSRATVLVCLHIPRMESVKYLSLPGELQDFVCLI